MARFEVVVPWFGVKAGDVIEAEAVNPAFAPNVRQLDDAPEPEPVRQLEVATPKKAATKK